MWRNMLEYVENMKEYTENTKEYVENVKEYEEICRYIGFDTPFIWTLGLRKIPISPPSYRRWDLEKFHAEPPSELWDLKKF